MKAPTIVVNARMLLKNRLDGTGWFAYQTLRRITSDHPDVRFLFLFDRPYDPEFLFQDNVTARVVYPPVRHGLLYYPWYEIGVKRVLDAVQPDLFLSPDGILSLGANCIQLAIVHDINFHHYPKDLPFWTSRYFNRFYPKSVRKATRIVTVSQYTKHDLMQTYGADEHKIDVVYNGIQEQFAPADEQEKENIRRTYADGQAYFLFVGSLHPRKNIPRLLTAFQMFKEETKSPMKLIIAGSLFWGGKDIQKILRQLSYRADILFTGRVGNDELYRLMAGAFCLAYVPYFEGFGIPLLEAMQSDVPIISANTTSLPEVAGDAALYVDPFRVEEIKNAMITMTTNATLRHTLIEHGRKRRKHFSWDSTADKLWASITLAMTEK